MYTDFSEIVMVKLDPIFNATEHGGYRFVAASNGEIASLHIYDLFVIARVLVLVDMAL